MPKRTRETRIDPSVVARFGEENCGACLLSLISEVDIALDDRSGNSCYIGTLDCCDHFFHAECIKTWGALDSSCPICRKGFRYSTVCTVDGSFVDKVLFTKVSFADTVCSSDDDEEEDQNEDVQAMEAIQDDMSTTRSRPRSASARQRRARKLSERTEKKIHDEVMRMREKLARERNISLEHRRRIMDRIDPKRLRSTIVKNLERLPYNFVVSGTLAADESAVTQTEQINNAEVAANPLPKDYDNIVRASMRALKREIQASNNVVNSNVLLVPKIQVKKSSAVAQVSKSRFHVLQKPAQYTKDFLLTSERPENQNEG